MENEIWKPLAGWESSHEGSTFGRIRSLPRWIYRKDIDWKRLVPGKLIAQREAHFRKSRQTYWRVTLLSKGRKKTLLVHALIAKTFLPITGPMVRHLDSDAHNNLVSNLAFGTAKDNAMDEIRNGRKKRASVFITSAHAKAILKLRENGISHREIERMSGVKRHIIRDVISGNMRNVASF